MLRSAETMKSESHVTKEVAKWTTWWVGQRRSKLEKKLNETMSVNPFLLPFLFSYHDLDNFSGLADLIIASHLMTGHNTGFGKLIDEKILPNVFDATKLDRAYRNSNPPFHQSCFDEIDHHIIRSDGESNLLSLKAGPWTIQLTMAVQLNSAFKEIFDNHPNSVNKIVVGVFYGKNSELTDKYDILRGINRGANHNVFNLTDRVEVYAGREFWSWLNDGEPATQEWVLKGILTALEREAIHETATELLNSFKQSVVDKYDAEVRNSDGTIDWYKLLSKING